MTPETLLVVRLEVQQWQIVLTALGELPLKQSLQVHQAMMQQLQPQTVAVNGVDPYPPSSEELVNDRT